MRAFRMLALFTVAAVAAACSDSPIAPVSPGEAAGNMMTASSYSVSLTPDNYYPVDEWVTVTATPSPAGSYWYEWEMMWCFNGWEHNDCNYQWHSYGSGQDLVQRSKYMGRGECWSAYRVTVYAYQGGPYLTQNSLWVYGAGQWVGSPGSPQPGCY